ncbi:MAG: hypothetical protein FWH01_14200, partial [Oscillospiraceae bacterium]|nr:hypothetical protein [Oscillospiraceae bacterium]
KVLYFKPAINADNFSCFFCCADGWGIYRREAAADGIGGGALVESIETLYGDLSGYTIKTNI